MTFTSDEQSRADKLLTQASGLIQAEARQRIELVTGDTLTVPGRTDARLRLPERPIVSVSSVTLDGETVITGVDPANYFQTADYLVRLSGWGLPDQALQVVYTHGYAVIPDEIKAVCCEQVVRAWVNPGNVLRESYGSDLVMYGAGMTIPTGLLLTPEEQRVIHYVLRRPAASVSLR